jgi:hypothetical protein
MTLGLKKIRLAPIDVFNICRFLTRFKAKTSPRALRYELEPGRRVKVVLEPWEHAFELSPESCYQGDKREVVRSWGRDRLKLLEPLLPVLRHVDLYLAGHGLPTVYVCDLGDVNFTLALSGWSEQDWTGDSRFGLLARRLDASADELSASYAALKSAHYASAQALADKTGLGVEKTRSALSFLCQAGRAMYDLSTGVYRHRDLFFSPFSAKQALAEARRLADELDPAAKAARQVFEAGNARLIARRPTPGGYKLSGSVRGTDDERVRPQLSVDHEGQIVEASCTCRYFRQHRLTKGPCEHVLALRLAHMSRLEKEDQKN